MKQTLGIITVVSLLLAFATIYCWAVWEYASKAPEHRTQCVDGVTYFSSARGISGAKFDRDGKPVACTPNR